MTDSPHTVVVGAGFGGLALAKALRKRPGRVTLVDRNNFHLFQPLLYQVATAGLESEEIAHAVRGIFQGADGVGFRMGTVEDVDLDAKTICVSPIAEEAASDAMAYDYLVLAAGAQTNYFGVEGAAEHSFGLKTLDDAIRLRSHVMRRFELADQDPGAVARGALTFVVVGGGPTGVEMSGALSELIAMVLKKDFPGVDVGLARVVLVEGGDRLLASFDPSLSRAAQRALERRGVEVRLGAVAARVEAGSVLLEGGMALLTHTVVWGAGVRAVGLAGTLADRYGLEARRGGRLPVDPSLRLAGRDDVFAIGDLAAATDDDGHLYPQLAPVAQQQARHVADEIARAQAGQRPQPFRYFDKGTMATIGRGDAVAELPGGVRMKGFAAWMAWLGLHLVTLVGFRNRLNVLINWTYNYVTYDRSARLITPHPEKKAVEEPDLPAGGDGALTAASGGRMAG